MACFIEPSGEGEQGQRPPNKRLHPTRARGGGFDQDGVCGRARRLTRKASGYKEIERNNMSTKNIFPILRFWLLSILVVSMAMSGCQTITLTPSSSPTSTPHPSPTIDPYQTWSTNFGEVHDLAASGIAPHNNLAEIDTTNVNAGGKSVRAIGSIGSAESGLQIDFTLSKLAGEDSIDLSDKTLNLEMYLPTDSPIYEFFIVVFGGRSQAPGKGWVVVRLAHAGGHRGKWRTYQVDIKQEIVLRTWKANSGFTGSGMTDQEVMDVLKNARQITVSGHVLKDRKPAESYFLVDRLGWEPSGPPPVYDASVDSLRKYAELQNLPFGGLMDLDGVSDPEYMRIFLQEFNTTLGWSTFPEVEAPGDIYVFDESWNPTPYADYMNAANGYRIIRYAIGDVDWVPAWLPGRSYEDAQVILENYIRALMDHYRGKTYIWILFNELMRYDIPYTSSYPGLGLKDRNQSPPTWHTSYSPFSNTPSDVALIEDAFRMARAADPDALLIINDASVEEKGTAKAEAFYKLVVKLKEDGTPIDGVGFQGHINLGQDGNFHEETYRLAFDPGQGFTGIAANVERYRALGLKVAFTEVDFSFYTADIDPTPQGQALLEQRRKLQADGYRSLLHIALTHDNVVAFNVFDWADQYSRDDPERGGSYSLEGFGTEIGLFDWFYGKKPSYDALLAELKGSSPFNK
jgi:endo-1,4-beta-xylanase